MKYFNTFPTTLIQSPSGDLLTLTNLLARVEIKPSLLNNPLLFYSYDIQDGDTPEIIASKYYGDPYRYWLVLFSNQIMNPQWDWPLDSNRFNDYIISKYTSAANGTSVLAYTQGTVYQYQKIVTTIDQTSQTTATNTIIVDFPTYNLIVPGTTTQKFPNGSIVSQIVSKNPLSIFDYEVQTNESKRTINLIAVDFVSEFESEFKKLMSQ